MTRERDIQRVLDHWFAERPTEVPDRVLDEVADRIGRQPQQPAWLTLWRDSHVNTYLKYAAAVAAVILVAVVGFAVLRPSSGSNIGGGTATPSPSPVTSPVATPSPSTSPSASIVFPPWFTQASDGAGILPAGSQTTRQFLSGSTFTVPEGWVNDLDNAMVYALFPDTPANEAQYALSNATAQNIVLAARVENNMFAICEATGLFHGATAAEVIDALVANEALSTTEPVDVTIGGLSGRQIDVQLSPDWTGSCSLESGDPPTRDYKADRNRIILLDTPAGTMGIGIGALGSAAFEGFVADAMPIVESFQFDLTP